MAKPERWRLFLNLSLKRATLGAWPAVHAFGRLSIKRKLILIIISALAVGLVLSGAGLFFHTQRTLEETVEAHATVVAQLIATDADIVTAVTQGTAAVAAPTLGHLRVDHHIVGAAIYDAQNRLLAKYVRANSRLEFPSLLTPARQTFYDPAHLAVRTPIHAAGARVGNVYLVTDLDQSSETIWELVGAGIAVSAAILILMFFLSFRLQRLITDPIAHLTATARAVSRDRDYSVRAVKRSNDELGGLADCFNAMLVEIDKRRIEADTARSELQERVNELAVEVAERERVEIELRKNRETLTDFVENASIGLHWVDADGVVIWANRHEMELLGYSPEEYLGHHISEFHADKPVIDDILARLGRNETLNNCEARLRCKDGSIRHVLINSNVYWEDGKFGHTRCFTRNITERKQAEEKFRMVVEATPSAIAMTDARGNIQLVNRAMETLFGYGRDELLTLSINRLVPQLQLNGGNGSRRAGLDVRGRTKGGGQIVLEVGLNPIVTDDGQHLLASFVDITERKKAEQELLRYTEELKRSNHELGQFAYVASHDLQEPLRAVSGCVQLLHQRYHQKLDDRATELINHTVAGAARMQALINDLLAYSRVGSRAKPLAPTEADLSLKHALENLSAAISETGATVKADPLPHVLADATQLTQVFQNLIGNALKFCVAAAPKIHVGAEARDGASLFFVRDNGMGIEPQYFERIFGVFQRLHGREQYPGNGIGLAICKKIVERHHGRIWVESRVGEGATFYFTVPALDAQYEQPQRSVTSG